MFSIFSTFRFSDLLPEVIALMRQGIWFGMFGSKSKIHAEINLDNCALLMHPHVTSVVKLLKTFMHCIMQTDAGCICWAFLHVNFKETSWRISGGTNHHHHYHHHHHHHHHHHRIRVEISWRILSGAKVNHPLVSPNQECAVVVWFERDGAPAIWK